MNKYVSLLLCRILSMRKAAYLFFYYFNEMGLIFTDQAHVIYLILLD